MARDLNWVSTPPGNPDWGQHGTWTASTIAGDGHGPDSGDGIIGVSPEAKILSVRVLPDRIDPAFGTYEASRKPWSRIHCPRAPARRGRRRGRRSTSIGYGSPSAGVRSALETPTGTVGRGGLLGELR